MLGKASTNQQLPQADAQRILGVYLDLISTRADLEKSMTKTMARLAETIEANLITVPYTPRNVDDMGGERSRLIKELSEHAYKINLTRRILVTLGGQPIAATPEQLWDLVIEDPRAVDLRIGQAKGVDPLVAAELMVVGP